VYRRPVTKLTGKFNPRKCVAAIEKYSQENFSLSKFAFNMIGGDRKN
jgi:hypothetical protein